MRNGGEQVKRCVLLCVEVPLKVSAYDVREAMRREAKTWPLAAFDVFIEADIKTTNKCTVMARDVIEVDK